MATILTPTQPVFLVAEEPVEEDVWYYVLSDWAQGDKEYHCTADLPIRCAAKDSGKPAVFRTGNLGDHKNYPKVPMEEDHQMFNGNLMSWALYNKGLEDLSPAEREVINKAFTGTFSSAVAFCNKTGFPDNQYPEPHRNYMTGEIYKDGKLLDLPLFNPLICATNSLQGTKVQDDRDRWYLKIASFRYGEPFPKITSRDIFNDPRIQFATTITSKKVGDGYAINHFPRLVGAYGVPVAIVTMEDHYYPMWYETGDCLVTYQAEKRWDMYNLPQEWPF